MSVAITITSDKFFQLVRDNSDAYLPQWGGVINRLAVGDMINDILDFKSEIQFQQLFYDTPYAHLSAHSPYFFEITCRETKFVKYLCNLNEQWGFLWAGASEPQLVKKHWQSLLTAVLPTQALTHFRFYSPVVFAKIANACTEKELAWLLGPLTHIFYSDIAVYKSQENNFTYCYCITNPRLATETPQAIADTYNIVQKPWWQVTDKQIQACQEELDRVYRSNLEQRVWEQYPELAQEVYSQYGSVTNFVNIVLKDAVACGFHTSEQKYRFLLLCLHYDFSSASCPQAKPALEAAVHNPDLALNMLEEILRNPVYERD